MNAREDARRFFPARTGHRDPDVVQRLPLLFQQQNDVDTGATADGGQQELHGAHGGVVTTDGGASVGFRGLAFFVGGSKVESIVQAVEIYGHGKRYSEMGAEDLIPAGSEENQGGHYIFMASATSL